MCIRYTLQITIIGITLWAINIPPRNVDISQNYSRVNNNALHVHVVKEVMAIQNLSQLERHGVYHTWNVQIVKLPLTFLQHSNCYQSLHKELTIIRKFQTYQKEFAQHGIITTKQLQDTLYHCIMYILVSVFKCSFRNFYVHV